VIVLGAALTGAWLAPTINAAMAIDIVALRIFL
jgi:hypothetical protein